MTREAYLDACIRASIRRGRFARDSDVVWEDGETVRFEGIRYYPVKYMLTFDRTGRAIHLCELHDLGAHSVTVARLEDVEEENRG